MKTKFFILVICVVFVNISVSAKMKHGSVLNGNSLTGFGKYTITVSEEPMVINDKEVKTYKISYENTSKPVLVGLVKDKQCVNFVVRNYDFEIQYTCNNGVFGVRKIEPRFQTLPNEVMDAKLDRFNYLTQRVISTGKKPEQELLGLIACYLPDLVNEEYQANF